MLSWEFLAINLEGIGNMGVIAKFGGEIEKRVEEKERVMGNSGM